MANDINRVTLVGRLTRDPEFKSINGTSLVNFSLANGRTYVSNGEKERSPIFSIVKSGETGRYHSTILQKGKQIAIEGRLKQDTWETPEGKKASRIRIVVENFQLLGSKDDSNSMGGSSSGGSSTFGGSSSPSPEYYNPPAPDGDDDIPF